MNRFPASITDGSSNTIFWIEKMGNCNGSTTLGSNTPGGSWWATTTVTDPTGKKANSNPWLPATSYSVYPPNVTFQVGANTNTCDYALPSTGHSGAIVAGLGDGSVRLITPAMSNYTFNLALIPNDGLVLGLDW